MLLHGQRGIDRRAIAVGHDPLPQATARAPDKSDALPYWLALVFAHSALWMRFASW